MSLPLWPLTYTSSFPSSACPFQFFLPSSYQPTLFRHPNLSPLLATMFIIPTPFFPFSSLNLSPLLATMFHTYPLLPIFFPKCFTLGWQLLRHLRRLRWPVTCTFCKFLPFLSPLLNLSQKHNQICHLRLQVSVVATHRPVRLYALLLSYFVTLLLLPKCFHLALTTKLVAGVWGDAGGIVSDCSQVITWISFVSFPSATVLSFYSQDHHWSGSPLALYWGVCGD